MLVKTAGHAGQQGERSFNLPCTAERSSLDPASTELLKDIGRKAHTMSPKPSEVLGPFKDDLRFFSRKTYFLKADDPRRAN
jgi:hypothetical protein